MRVFLPWCLVLLMCGCLLVVGCGADVSAVAGKYAPDLQRDIARDLNITAWTLEFKADGTFQEVIVVRNTDKSTRRGTFEIMDNSINMYDLNGALLEDDFTVQEDRLIDHLGGVWMKQ